MGLVIRKATEEDAPALSHICLLTADAGKSAEGLHVFGELPGLIWAVPYVLLPTTWGFVLVNENGEGQDLVVGYIVGTTDTRAFEQYAAQHWWPAQAEKYSLTVAHAEPKPADMRCIKMLRNMEVAPDANLDFADAHMHINILKDYQGKGWGRRLVGRVVEYLKAERVKGDGLWLGLDPRNGNARKFYEKLGFEPIQENYMGLKFANWNR